MSSESRGNGCMPEAFEALFAAGLFPGPPFAAPLFGRAEPDAAASPCAKVTLAESESWTRFGEDSFARITGTCGGQPHSSGTLVSTLSILPERNTACSLGLT